MGRSVFSKLDPYGGFLSNKLDWGDKITYVVPGLSKVWKSSPETVDLVINLFNQINLPHI